MSAFDKLMDDIYKNFDDDDQEGTKSSENDFELVSTEVIENQVALEGVFENADPAPPKLESPAQVNEAAITEPTNPVPEEEAGPSHETSAEIVVSVSKDGQYSLFGDDDFTATSDQDNGKEDGCGATSATATTNSKKGGKKDSKPPNPSTSAKPKEEIKVTADWTLHYSAQTFRVGGEGGLFPEMTDTDEKTLEEVRQKMEEDFFEFTKSRVKWDYDKDLKRLYPDVFGTSKGGV
ncbi:hypothetical protein [Brevibacillus sp. 179-C9.3 HS]|uniref:hypothetical protein n=1 Tax=unclassified Brevibacillus TaxID=2684853 RepID=UPI0039A1B0F3